MPQPDPLPLFKSLADSTRLRILRVLCSGAFNVNELVGILGIGQSRVSRHLKILSEAGLLEVRREGSWAYYRLAPVNGSGRGSAIARALIDHIERSLPPEQAGIAGCYERRRRLSQQFFRGAADGWDRRRDRVQGPPAYLDRLLEGVGSGADTLADLGTGTGVLLAPLSTRARRVIGIDASPEMLQAARQHAQGRGLENVDLRLGALEHLPLPDASVDGAVANMVLHHVADPRSALAEVRRILRPSGKLAIAELRRHGREEYREKLGDLWLGFERRELERWLGEADLWIEQSEEIPPAPGRPGVILALASRCRPRRRPRLPTGPERRRSRKRNSGNVKTSKADSFPKGEDS
jgi:ArsR family transcriptional regulator